MRILFTIMPLLFQLAISAQQLEVEGKMLVKDINTIATFQSAQKNSFIKLATNGDLLKSTNIGYFDDATDQYFFIDVPSGDFGDFVILADGTVRIGFSPNDPVAGAQLGVMTDNTRGIFASSVSNAGVWGRSTSAQGIFGQSITSIGVEGYSVNSYGVSASGGGDNPVDFWAEHNTYGGTSSRRWKRHIENIPDALSKLSKLRGVYFDWDLAHGGKHAVGFIAEEVGAVLPELVFYEENGIDAKGMDYTKMTPLLVEAAKAMRKEYQEKFTDQEARIVSLEMQLNLLREMIESQSAQIQKD